jgi:hypothetical protein
MHRGPSWHLDIIATGAHGASSAPGAPGARVDIAATRSSIFCAPGKVVKPGRTMLSLRFNCKQPPACRGAPSTAFTTSPSSCDSRVLWIVGCKPGGPAATFRLALRKLFGSTTGAARLGCERLSRPSPAASRGPHSSGMPSIGCVNAAVLLCGCRANPGRFWRLA